MKLTNFKLKIYDFLMSLDVFKDFEVKIQKIQMTFQSLTFLSESCLESTLPDGQF